MFETQTVKQRMECLRFDKRIRANLDQLFNVSQSSNNQGAKDIYQYLSRVYVLFQWNKDPVTKTPLLQFNEFEHISREQLDHIGLPPDVDLVVLDNKCKFRHFMPVQTFAVYAWSKPYIVV